MATIARYDTGNGPTTIEITPWVILTAARERRSAGITNDDISLAELTCDLVWRELQRQGSTATREEFEKSLVGDVPTFLDESPDPT